MQRLRWLMVWTLPSFKDMAEKAITFIIKISQKIYWGFLEMFSFIKKFTIAILVFCSVQYGAYGSEINHDMGIEKPPQRTIITVEKKFDRFQDGLPLYVMKDMFEQLSKYGIDPRILEQVCKHWYHCMRYQIPESGVLTKDKMGIPYTTKLNDIFMEDCLRRSRESIVSRAILIYRKDQPDQCVIKFSDFKDGAADLSGCGDEEGRQVFTTSIERFFEVGGANKDRLVTFIGPCHLVVQNLLTTNAKKNCIRILWRDGNWKDNSMFDALTSASCDELSKVNMFQNWSRLPPSVIRFVAPPSAAIANFHVRL